jgi:hypothetical protein
MTNNQDYMSVPPWVDKHPEGCARHLPRSRPGAISALSALFAVAMFVLVCLFTIYIALSIFQLRSINTELVTDNYKLHRALYEKEKSCGEATLDQPIKGRTT